MSHVDQPAYFETFVALKKAAGKVTIQLRTFGEGVVETITLQDFIDGTQAQEAIFSQHPQLAQPLQRAIDKYIRIKMATGFDTAAPLKEQREAIAKLLDAIEAPLQSTGPGTLPEKQGEAVAAQLDGVLDGALATIVKNEVPKLNHAQMESLLLNTLERTTWQSTGAEQGRSYTMKLDNFRDKTPMMHGGNPDQNLRFDSDLERYVQAKLSMSGQAESILRGMLKDQLSVGNLTLAIRALETTADEVLVAQGYAAGRS